MTPTPDTELMAVTLSRELFDFLMGVGEIDGTSFGELNDGLPGAFWWRGLLRAAERETTRIASTRPADSALAYELEQFEGSDAPGNGDFSVCIRAAKALRQPQQAKD